MIHSDMCSHIAHITHTAPEQVPPLNKCCTGDLQDKSSAVALIGVSGVQWILCQSDCNSNFNFLVKT